MKELCSSFLTTQAIAQGTCPATLPNEFKMELIRVGTDEVIDSGVKVTRVYGDVWRQQSELGRFFDEGTYQGTLRYHSNHNFVVSSCGVAAQTRDFLIEVKGVKDANGKSRSKILFHPGFLPSHSEGCVLFGARERDAQGNLLPLGPDYPLVKIRREFYGTNDPAQCPNR